MSAFVLDCSIAVAWLFEDEAKPQTDALLDRLKDDGAHVPGLWRLEIGNVLASAERRHQMRHDLRINGQIDACHAFGVMMANPASLRSDTFMHCARRPDAARIA